MSEEQNGRVVYLNEVDPIIAVWIERLLNSDLVADALSNYRNSKIDVTLSASSGRAVLAPKVTIW